MLIVDAKGNIKKDQAPKDIVGILHFFGSRQPQTIVINIQIPEILHFDVHTPQKLRNQSANQKLLDAGLIEKFKDLNDMFDRADVIISHGVDFDQKMICRVDEFSHWNMKPWICTMKQFEWPSFSEFVNDKGQRKWFRLADICTSLGVTFDESNNAFTLWNCLLKVDHLSALLRLYFITDSVRINFVPSKKQRTQ